MSKYFATIDVDHSGVNAIAVRWDRTGKCKLEAFCRTSSKGFHKGLVVDAVMATSAITGVMNKLKARTGKRVQNVYAGVSSASLKNVLSSGISLLSKYGREISENDIKKCIQAASTIKMPLEEEIVHKVVKGFTVDSEKEIKNPLNLEGIKLGVDVNIITIDSSVLNNMSKCISNAGFVPAGFVFSGLASAYRVLTETERERGAALLDMTRKQTEISLFCRGIMSHCQIFPVGAEDVLQKDGELNRGELEELIPKVISLPGWQDMCKVIMIGEGSFSDGLVGYFDNNIDIPVKAGLCITKSFEELPPERGAYLASLGIIDYLQEERKKKHQEGNFLKKFFNKVINFMDKYF